MRSPRPQAARQLSAQLTTALDEQRLVDRFVAHVHARVLRELDPEPSRDLLWRPPRLQPRGDLIAQWPGAELARLRLTRSFICSMVRPQGPVVPTAAVVRDFSADRRGRATEPRLSPPFKPRLISSRSATDRRKGPGIHSNCRDSRFPGPASTRVTVAREQPIVAATSHSFSPLARSLRTSRPCCSVSRGFSIRSSRSGQLKSGRPAELLRGSHEPATLSGQFDVSQ
jgi:hypothetical protein